MNDYSAAPGQTPSSLPTIAQELRELVVLEDPTAPPTLENQPTLGLVFFRPKPRGWRGFQHLMRLLALVEYGQIWVQTPEILSLFSVDASPGDASAPINISELR